jgi:3-hydroxyacyl-CoA dehydrogenase
MPPTAYSTRLDSVAVVTIDNPPVNAMALPVRVALRDALAEAAGDAAVGAVVLTGAGKLVTAGADIREFDTGVSNESPTLRDLIAAVEDSAKPVVAALHGTAVGGGCELALACHARLAHAGAQIGLPEVRLGLVPGAGGTQRLPRLIGVEAALDVILSGKPLSAQKARDLGLVDVLVPAGEDVVTAAKQIAERLASAGSWVKTRDRDEHLAAARGSLDVFAEQRRQVARKQRGFEAPLACIDCVEAAVTQPFDEGLAFERETFQRCRTSPQSAAQRHAFFAEREARRVRGVSQDTTEWPIARGAVIGCGTMGGGIAMCFANAGIPVVVTEESAQALERGMGLVRKNYAGSVTRGS